MMKQLKILAAGLALTAASAVSAATVTDTNNYGQSIFGAGIGFFGSTLTDQFNITPGYNPLTQTVTSATASFELWDGAFSESVRIDLGSTNSWLTNGSFDGDITIGGSLVGSLLVDLGLDGIISYTVRANSGTFFVERATLTAEVQNRVPEPASLALVGLALAGIGAQRKLKARK